MHHKNLYWVWLERGEGIDCFANTKGTSTSIAQRQYNVVCL